ncbi:hypothetical protein B5X24_HaOG213208 [Helicoverpa armigera]|uniref:Uncharacterized protein n=1 Tax=Helicoverpa armigera TaxID=29058 RepID=A0A2W1BFF5_HELAM|nr:hypothetical protein B5X24_HaOG213208 [Helicoverpa armigera]
MFVHLFACMYLIVFDSVIYKVLAVITVLDRGIYPLEKGSVGIQFYIDLENGNHQSTCKVTSRPTMCCLSDEDFKDCSVDTIYGENEQYIKPQSRETLIYVYPSLYQYDQIGYCDFGVEYKCRNARRTRKFSINIPFDTQIANKKYTSYLKAYTDVKGSDCDSLDEDALHECEAVNCDLKYSGRRPYFEGRRGKCVSAPVCDTSAAKELPDIVYVPKNNICRDLDRPITLGDIYVINTGLGVVTESTKSVNEVKVLLKSNCSTISQNVHMLKDMMFGTLAPTMVTTDTTEYKTCCLKAIFSIIGYIIALCGLLLSIVCCLHTSLWCYSKYKTGELKEVWAFKPNENKPKDHLRKPSNISREVTDNLLREVIVHNLPLEMRDSMVDICQRIDQQIKRKKRYRIGDLRTEATFRNEHSATITDTSSESSQDEVNDTNDADVNRKLLSK